MRRPLELILVVLIVAGCGQPPRAEEPTPSPGFAQADPTATPSPELIIVRDGFQWSQLGEEDRTALAELESAYRAVIESQAPHLRGSTLIETVGAQGPGAYVETEKGGHWLLYRPPGRSEKTLRQVPEVVGSRRSWERENNRFVYVDEEGRVSRAYLPSLDAVLPLVGGLVWSGFTPDQLEQVEEALRWLEEVAPHRLEFLQGLGIPIVIFRGRDLVLAGLVDRRGIVLYRDAFSLESAPAEINRLWFLAVLYHEAIHVRQGPEPGVPCEREGEAVAEEIGLMEELRPFISAPHRVWVDALIDEAERYAAVSCGISTPTLQPTATPTPVPRAACPSPGPTFVDNNPYADFKPDVMLALGSDLGVDLSRANFLLDALEVRPGELQEWGLASGEFRDGCLYLQILIRSPAQYFSEMGGLVIPGPCGEVSDPNTFMSQTVLHELRHAWQYQHYEQVRGVDLEEEAHRFVCEYVKTYPIPYPIYLW